MGDINWYERRYKEREEAIQNHHDHWIWMRNITSQQSYGVPWQIYWRLSKRFLKFLGGRINEV